MQLQQPTPALPTIQDTGHQHTPQPEPLTRPSIPSLIGSFTAVILPFLGLIAAAILLWDARFSWLNLSMLLGGYLLTALGITVGYHRLFTHKSFKTNPVVAAILGVLGSMAVEGPLLEWVSYHRRHHQHADKPDDPHSPHHHGSGFIAWCRGLAHAHLGWLFTRRPTRRTLARYVPDLQADPVLRTVSRLFPLWAALSVLIPALIGLAVTQTLYGALMGFIWGGLLRIFLVHHVTWSVNSICHIWGSRPFETHDASRNNPVFGILALGEGWHNTHHAFPTSARHGLEWWQIDISYLIIKAMALLGLAKDLKLPAPERVESKRRRHSPAAPRR